MEMVVDLDYVEMQNERAIRLENSSERARSREQCKL